MFYEVIGEIPKINGGIRFGESSVDFNLVRIRSLLDLVGPGLAK